MSTKIHATVDALGNPTGFHLAPGQAHDLEGADMLLKDTPGASVIVDKACDAQARVIEPLHQAGKAVTISPKASRKHQRKLRPPLVQGPSPDRELLCPTQAVPCHRHMLRQDRAQLPRRHSLGCRCRLAQLMTRPSIDEVADRDPLVITTPRYPCGFQEVVTRLCLSGSVSS